MKLSFQRLGAIVAFGVFLGSVFQVVQLTTTPSTKLISIAHAKEKSPKVKSLTWEDLLPVGATGIIPFDAASDFPEVSGSPFPSTEFGSETGGVPNFSKKPEMDFNAPRADLAGQRIALAGYMTPISVENNKTRTFLLVPYVGACIHVPAPPPNQVILVESADPVDVREMWTPFVAVGEVSVETIDTGLAEVGYTMRLERIEPYVESEEN